MNNMENLNLNKKALDDFSQQVVSFISNSYSQINVLGEVKSYRFSDDRLKEHGFSHKVISAIWKRQFPNWPKSQSVNNITTMGLFLVAYFSYTINKNDEDVKNILRLYGYCIYSSMLYKYFSTGMDSTIAMMALDKLTTHHTFKQEGNIAKAIYKNVEDVYKNWKNGFYNRDMNSWYRLMLDIRVRFNQSFRSFAQKYYSIFHDMQSEINKYKEDDVGVHGLEDLIDNIVTKLIYNSYISRKSIDMTHRLTSLSKSNVELIARSLTNPELAEELRTFYIKLFSHFIDINMNDSYFNPEIAIPLLNKIMLAKRISQDHLRYYIKILMEVAMGLNPDLSKVYTSVSGRTKTFMEVSLLYYLYFYSKEITNL